MSRPNEPLPDPAPVEIELAVTDRLAVAKNVATNGRLFCLMLFVAALVLAASGFGSGYAKIAALATLPVGASCVVDQMEGKVAAVASILVYVYAAVLALVLIFATFQG